MDSDLHHRPFRRCSTQELVALLRESGVDLLVDVRTVRRSRFNPQFNAPTPCRKPWLRPGSIIAICRRLAARHRPKDALPFAEWAVAKRGVPGLRRLCDDARRRSAPRSVNCAAWQSTTPAPSCAPRRSGGAVIAASSPITRWLRQSRSSTSWRQARSSRRASRRVRSRDPMAQSCIRRFRGC